ncbi:MAG: hypothetical protein LBD37_02950 [Treponema sp.]|jgi:hypothetical protein|nr:hypothetical protein [Treponema sp.]
MKKQRYLPVLVLLFLPSIASAQVLIARDIDIFLNIKSGITSIQPREEDRHWKKYTAALEALGNIMSLYQEEDEEVWFAGFTRRYNQLLKARAPRELAEYFQSIGWDQQGNKKFLTILMGAAFLLLQREMPNTSEEDGNQRYLLLMEKLITLFDPADMRIIEGRLDDLIRSF